MDWNREFTEIKVWLAKLEAHQIDIKEDLKDHIKRTHNLEGRTESIEKYVHEDRAVKLFLTKTLGILALVATIAGAFVAYFKN